MGQGQWHRPRPFGHQHIDNWAAGVPGNYVLDQLAELTGMGPRIVVLPFVNQGVGWPENVTHGSVSSREV